LKTGFTAEAVSAARYRAFADRAERDGMPNPVRHWRRLAGEKDALAITELEAAGQVRGAATDLAAAISEERYENEVLYPKMVREVDGETAEVLLGVIGRQKDHLAHLERLRQGYNASQGDVETPEEVE
jgi:rubrerythrin